MPTSPDPKSPYKVTALALSEHVFGRQCQYAAHEL